MAYKFKNYSGDDISDIFDIIKRGYQAGLGILLNDITFSVNETWLRNFIVDFLGGKTSEEILISGISLSASTITLSAIGETKQLIATIYPSDATNTTLKWTSADESIAYVNSNGLVTAVGSGTTTITAEATDGSGVKATCTIVISIAPEVISVSSVTINKSTATLSNGETTTFTATVLPTDATDKSVIWTTENSSVLAIVSGKKTNQVTVKAISSTTDETINLTVKTTDGNKTASVPVLVKAAEIPVVAPDILYGTIVYTASTPVTQIQEAIDNSNSISLKTYSTIGSLTESVGGTKYTYIVILIPVYDDYSQYQGYTYNSLDGSDENFATSAESKVSGAEINGNKNIIYNGITYRVYAHYNSKSPAEIQLKVK